MPAPAWVALAWLLPALFAAGYYFALTVVGRVRHRPGPPPPAVPPLLGVLIPAHNEETTLAATVTSVLGSDYPPDRLRVLVVADNCTDATATVARRAGADVLERFDDVRRGKGYALEVGLAQLLAAGPEGVLILDADCELPPDALRCLSADLSAGCDAVQAARLPRNRGNSAAAVAAVGSSIENAVSAGRCRLGLPVALRGSGMLFSHRLLERLPWRAYGLVEDAEYGANLARNGVRIRFRPDVVVTGEVPADAATLARQRTRWRTALWSGGPAALPGRWLASKPLVLAHLAGTTAVVAGSAALLPAAWAVGLTAGLTWALTMTAIVYAAALAEVGGWRQVGPAAGLAVRLAGVTLAGAMGRPAAWERTRRLAEG